MKTGTKILLGILTAGAVGGGYYLYNKRRNAASETDPSVIPDSPTPVGPGLPPNSNPVVVKPASLNYDTKFTKSDKAHVMIMQKMIGVVPDGAWGSKTDAALPKNLSRPFSLNQLQSALNALKNAQSQADNAKKYGLKNGDQVYAAYTTDVEVTKGAKYKDLKWTAIGAKRKQEVTKGQYLGKIVVLNPNSIWILNNFNELVLTNYSKVSKTQLSGLSGAKGVSLL